MRYGWLLAAMLVACKDSDDDGVRDKKDCLPDDPRANPDAAEVCDGIDNNCDGQVDEDVAIIAYFDVDDDGFGDPEEKRRVCELPDNGSLEAGDCDDTNPDVHPGVAEVCNELDDDCNEQVDEGVTIPYFADEDDDGHGLATDSVDACEAPDGYVTTSDDCDDTEPASWEGKAEECDAVDNDCDGDVDEDLPVGRTWADLDGDGYGDPGAPLVGCGAVEGVADNALDCDDDDPSRSPDAFETRGNAVDEDCDGFIDEFGVGPPGNEFPTVDDALVLAPDGSVVQLDQGLTVDTIDLTGHDVTFAGEGCDRTTLYADGLGTALTIGDGRVIGLTISGGTGTLVNDELTGGGVLVTGDTVLQEVCVTDNTAGRGGGIAITGGEVTVVDSLVSENSAETYGGGIWVAWSAASVEIRRSRVLSNDGLRGGGIYFGGSSGLVANTIIAANTCDERGCGAMVDTAVDLAGLTRFGAATFENDTFHANSVRAGVASSDGIALLSRAGVTTVRNSLFTGHPDPWNLLEASQAYQVNGVITTAFVGFRGNSGADLDLDTYVLDRIDGDPLYIQDDPTLPPVEWDLRLRDGSGMVDVGDPTLDDLDGSRSDLGAFGGLGAGEGWDYGLVVDDDGDGIPSGWEVRYGTSVWSADVRADDDGDGATNLEEYDQGSDPGTPDTDGDGVDDGVELGLGTNASAAWDQAPLADAGPDHFGLTGNEVALDGAASFDPNDDAITFSWSLTSVPPGSLAGLSGGAGATATLDPDLPGTYVVSLTVDDGAASRSDELIVRAWDGIVVPDDEPTIEAALAAVSDGDAIGLRAGTYVGTWETSGRDVTLIGLADADEVVLEGAGADSVITAEGGRLALGHLTVQGGSAAQGGGVHASDLVGLDLQDVTLRWNRAVNGGGLSSLNTPVIGKDLRVLDNLADAQGGGMHVLGGQHVTLVLEGALLAGNVGVSGGALFLDGTDADETDDSDYFLRATTFADNTARDGSAWWHSGDGSDVRADGVNVVGNHGSSLVWADTGRDILLDSAFDENDATLFFGAAGPETWQASNLQAFGAVWDDLPSPAFWTGAGAIATSDNWIVGDPLLGATIDDGDRTDDAIFLRGSAALDLGFVEHVDRDATRADAGACSGPSAGAECARARVDVDQDGLPDAWELAFGLDPSRNDAASDADGDGTTNTQELTRGTLPDTDDSDHDGVTDGDETRAGDDPRSDRDHRARAVSARTVYAEVGTQAVLDGRSSVDPDGGAVTFRWRLIQAPIGSAAALQGATSAVAAITPDLEGAYRLGLVVDDGDGPSRELILWVITPATLTIPGDFATLQEAYDAAGPGDTLLLGAGDWPLTFVIDAKPVTIAGSGMDTTTLHAIGSDVVLEVSTTNSLPNHLTVRDLTLTGGANQEGGAIACRGGQLDLARVRLRDNVAMNGGAMFLDGCDASLVDVELLRNHAASAGGAIWASESVLSMDGGRATQNDSMNEGGAFFLIGTTTEIRNAEFHRNESDDDGAAILYSFLVGVPASGSMLLEHVTFAGNFGVNGAVHRRDATPTTITNSLFLKNGAYGFFDQGARVDLDMDFNGFYANTTHTSPSSLSGNPGDLRGDPMLPIAFDQFEEGLYTPDEEDLRLQAQSPYRDIATGDLDPDGGAPDMGAWGGPGARAGWDEHFVDTDGDRMPDVWESEQGLNGGVADANQDRDGDGLTNLQELTNLTDAQDDDSDHDGVRDAAEVNALPAPTDPTDPADHVAVPEAGNDANIGQVGLPFVRVGAVATADPQGDPVTHRWTLTKKPARSSLTSASLSGANTSTVTITPDVPGMFEVTLVMGDANGTSDPDAFLLRVVGDVVVPLDYPTVADAVFASWDGGRVLIGAGVWREHIDLDGRDLDLVGQGRATTILDADGTGRAIRAGRAEDLLLQDLTVRNGVSGRGGNLFAEAGSSSLITLDNVTLEDGRAAEGGNVYLNNADLVGLGVRVVGGFGGYRGGGLMAYDDIVTLDQSLVAGNAAVDSEGGGLRLLNTVLTATNVVFHDNLADRGGAIQTEGSGTYTLDHVTVTWNEATTSGAAFQVGAGASWDVIDSILVDNVGANLVSDEANSTYAQTFTMAQDNDAPYALVSALTVDPVDGTNGNLIENAYVPGFSTVTDDGDWSNDDWTLLAGSSAINTGDPSGARDVNGTRADMGAHGGPGGSFTP